MPNTVRLERLAALTGIVAVVLLVVSIVIAGSPPVVGDSTEKITSYLADHDTSIRVSQYVAGLALALFVWFIGTLWAHLRRSEGAGGRLAQIFLVAATALVAAFVVQGALLVVASYEPTGGAAAISAAFYRLSAELAPNTSFLVGPMVGALGLSILRYGALDRPLGIYSAAFAVYELLEGACVIGRDGAISPGGLVNEIGLLAFVVWAVWTSTALYRRIAAPTATTTTATTMT